MSLGFRSTLVKKLALSRVVVGRSVFVGCSFPSSVCSFHGLFESLFCCTLSCSWGSALEVGLCMDYQLTRCSLSES